MDKKHKETVENCRNKLNPTHICERESKIFRNGEVHFLDLECHPNKNNLNLFKPTAIEVEVGSGKLQRDSNLEDLKEWKKKNPDGEIFQIENAEQLDTSKLRKNQIPIKKNIRPLRRFAPFRRRF